jgi:hypothetical protein
MADEGVRQLEHLPEQLEKLQQILQAFAEPARPRAEYSINIKAKRWEAPQPA